MSHACGFDIKEAENPELIEEHIHLIQERRPYIYEKIIKYRGKSA
jgi:hypothetical protein